MSRRRPIVPRVEDDRPPAVESAPAAQLPPTLISFSFNFHWPSALAGSMLISLPWLSGLMFTSKTVESAFVLYELTGDGRNHSTLITLSRGNDLKQSLFINPPLQGVPGAEIISVYAGLSTITAAGPSAAGS